MGSPLRAPCLSNVEHTKKFGPIRANQFLQISVNLCQCAVTFFKKWREV